MNSNNIVEVEIFNQRFTLFSELEGKERLQKLAAMVDERMREIYKNTRLSSAIKIAILTALNLADELSLLTEKQSRSEKASVPVSENPSGLKEEELSERVLSVARRMEKLIQDLVRE